MISDTLGHSQAVCQATMYPHRYEWLSDNEIVLLQLGRLSGGKATKLSIIDLKTGQEEIIIDKKEKFREADEHDSTQFDGPMLSIEGNVYYTMEKRSGKRSAIPKSRYAKRDDREILRNNHYLAWGEDGVYKHWLNRRDSLRLGPRLHPHPILPPELSWDAKYIIYRGTLLRLGDSAIVIIDTMFRSRPANTVVCGIIFGAFSSAIPEFLFQRSCDDGETYNVLSVWTYNLNSRELTNLDTLANLTQCSFPVYAPDGLTIACLSQQKAYLIKRRVL